MFGGSVLQVGDEFIELNYIGTSAATIRMHYNQYYPVFGCMRRQYFQLISNSQKNRIVAIRSGPVPGAGWIRLEYQ